MKKQNIVSKDIREREIGYFCFGKGPKTRE